MYLICMKGYYNMDLTSPRTIRNIQEQFGFTFKKGLGQNFLTARNILEEIVDAAEIESGVIEVGPGFGVLTSELAQNSDKVVTIEIDERLIDVLDYTLAEYDNVKIINEDILKLDLKKVIDDEFNGEKVSIAANLPYYITTPIITKLLEEKLPISGYGAERGRRAYVGKAVNKGLRCDNGALSVLYGAVNRGKCSCVTVRSAAKGGQCGVKIKGT